jgi:hypothetical protein
MAVYDFDKDGNQEAFTAYGNAIQVWDLYTWQLDHAFTDSEFTMSNAPILANVWGNSDLEMITDGSWPGAMRIVDSTYTTVATLPNWGGGNQVTDIDNDGLNEIIFSRGIAGYEATICYDTDAMTLGALTDAHYYGLRRTCAEVYYPPYGLPSTATYAVTVYAKNSSGGTLAGATVVLFDGTTSFTIIANGEGIAEFPSVVPGSYTITVSASGYNNWISPTITVPPSQDIYSSNTPIGQNVICWKCDGTNPVSASFPPGTDCQDTTYPYYSEPTNCGGVVKVTCWRCLNGVPDSYEFDSSAQCGYGEAWNYLYSSAPTECGTLPVPTPGFEIVILFAALFLVVLIRNRKE